MIATAALMAHQQSKRDGLGPRFRLTSTLRIDAVEDWERAQVRKDGGNVVIEEDLPALDTYHYGDVVMSLEREAIP